MSEKPDLEKILEIIITQVDSSEKPLVELYFKNPDALSPEYREKAARMIKQFMAKYPELAVSIDKPVLPARNELTELIEHRHEIRAVLQSYKTWRDSISGRMCSYTRCCQNIMQKYVDALDIEINEISAKIAQITEIEEKHNSGQLCKVDAHKWSDISKNKRDRLEKLQKNYQRNTFFLKEESKILTFFKEKIHIDPDYE